MDPDYLNPIGAYNYGDPYGYEGALATRTPAPSFSNNPANAGRSGSNFAGPVYPPAYSPNAPISYSPSSSVENTNKTSETLGTISKLSALLPGVGSVISAVTGVGSMIMNWWATNKQLKEQREARAEARKYVDSQNAENKRRYDIENERQNKVFEEQRKGSLRVYNLTAEKQKADIGFKSEELASNKEQKQWDRWLGVMQNMTNMMSSPQSRAGFADVYRKG